MLLFLRIIYWKVLNLQLLMAKDLQYLNLSSLEDRLKILITLKSQQCLQRLVTQIMLTEKVS